MPPRSTRKFTPIIGLYGRSIDAPPLKLHGWDRESYSMEAIDRYEEGLSKPFGPGRNLKYSMGDDDLEEDEKIPPETACEENFPALGSDREDGRKEGDEKRLKGWSKLLQQEDEVVSSTSTAKCVEAFPPLVPRDKGTAKAENVTQISGVDGTDEREAESVNSPAIVESSVATHQEELKPAEIPQDEQVEPQVSAPDPTLSPTRGDIDSHLPYQTLVNDAVAKIALLEPERVASPRISKSLLERYPSPPTVKLPVFTPTKILSTNMTTETTPALEMRKELAYVVPDRRESQEDPESAVPEPPARHDLDILDLQQPYPRDHISPQEVEGLDELNHLISQLHFNKSMLERKICILQRAADDLEKATNGSSVLPGPPSDLFEEATHWRGRATFNDYSVLVALPQSLQVSEPATQLVQTIQRRNGFDCRLDQALLDDMKERAKQEVALELQHLAASCLHFKSRIAVLERQVRMPKDGDFTMALASSAEAGFQRVWNAYDAPLEKWNDLSTPIHEQRETSIPFESQPKKFVIPQRRRSKFVDVDKEKTVNIEKKQSSKVSKYSPLPTITYDGSDDIWMTRSWDIYYEEPWPVKAFLAYDLAEMQWAMGIPTPGWVTKLVDENDFNVEQYLDEQYPEWNLYWEMAKNSEAQQQYLDEQYHDGQRYGNEQYSSEQHLVWEDQHNPAEKQSLSIQECSVDEQPLQLKQHFIRLGSIPNREWALGVVGERVA